jgi:hypothetical protein
MLLGTLSNGAGLSSIYLELPRIRPEGNREEI